MKEKRGKNLAPHVISLFLNLNAYNLQTVIDLTATVVDTHGRSLHWNVGFKKCRKYYSENFFLSPSGPVLRCRINDYHEKTEKRFNRRFLGRNTFKRHVHDNTVLTMMENAVLALPPNSVIEREQYDDCITELLAATCCVRMMRQAGYFNF